MSCNMSLTHHFALLYFIQTLQAVKPQGICSFFYAYQNKKSSAAEMPSIRLARSRGFRALRPVTVNRDSRRLTIFKRAYGSQGYGDAEGDPVGSNPQDQPANTEATHSIEHPGPATPHMKGGKKGGKTPQDASAESGGSRSKDAIEKGESPTAGRLGKND